MKKEGKALPKTRLCEHCRGRRVCNCDQCIQTGGTCGYCNGYGHLVIPTIRLDLGEKPAARPKVPRVIRKAAWRK